MQVRGFRATLAMVTVLACSGAAAAERGYLELEGDDFVIVSAASERDTHAIASKVLMFRAAMEAVFGLRVNLTSELRIHALSASDWARYARPRPEVAGYFVAHPFSSDLLFDVEAEDPRAHELMLHEYTHHVLRSLSSGRYPAFFDEGLAEVFSTATLRNGVVQFAPRPEYVALLKRGEWLPFERLLEIGRRDAEYVDHTLSPSFYAQAWATMYYAVAANSPFGSRLLDYIRDLNSGVPRETAAQALVGDTIRHANREIARFILTRERLPVARVRVGGVAGEDGFRLRRLTDVERALTLGELLIRLGDRSDDALELLASVTEVRNERARIGQVLAYLQANDRTAARGVLERLDPTADLAPTAAVMLGRVLLELARHGDEGAVSSRQAREWLLRARDLFRDAMQDERSWIEASHGYVLASLSLEEHDAALVELAGKAYAAAPKNAELAVSLAILHELQGRKVVARRYWSEAARHLHEGPTRTRILHELAVQDSAAQR